MQYIRNFHGRHLLVITLLAVLLVLASCGQATMKATETVTSTPTATPIPNISSRSYG